jgi:cytochrome c oxidase assembly factor CtaG
MLLTLVLVIFGVFCFNNYEKLSKNKNNSKPEMKTLYLLGMIFAGLIIAWGIISNLLFTFFMRK